MEKATEIDQETIEKSIFPEIGNIKYQNINNSINGRKLYIGEALASICDLKKKLKSKDEKKLKSLENRKGHLKNIKLNFFLKPKSRANLNYVSKTEKPVFPKTALIEKLKKRENSNNILSFSSDDTKKETSFFTSQFHSPTNSIINSLNSFNSIQSINSPNQSEKDLKIKPLKRRKYDRNHSKSYNSTLIKNLRLLGYKNGKVGRQIKTDKVRFNTIKNNMSDKYRIYHWKYIMTDNEKDLRPDTFFGKAGEEVLNNQGFNKRLDNMISHLKFIDAVNFKNIIERHKVHLSMEEKLKNRAKKEREKIEIIDKILESDKMICKNIMSE